MHQVRQGSEKCELMWAFRGSLHFNDTRQKDVGNVYELRSKNLPEETTAQGKENVTPPQKRSTFNSQKVGLDDEQVVELWKQYSRPTTASLSKIAGIQKGTSKPKRKPKMEEPKESSISTKDGKLKIKKHGIHAKAEPTKILKCAVCKWETTLGSQLTAHVKDKHPNFRFKCKYCKNEYVTFSSKFKHEMKHSAPTHVCSFCGKGFYFPLDLSNHEKLHTKKDMVPCTNCDKKFPTQRLMDQHVVTHQQQEHKCDQCNRICNTRQNLRQHQKGAHGSGWPAYCGKFFQWPCKLNSHQKHCTKCIHLKKKKPKK